ncbi:L,D-transpeptidase family protein [Thioclava sp. GXIMD4216]|uniref:L,D-transpeptidase family protein n=1 Tax=Thioclava litoralis TaxID=3076557 RepID=A0ABZ1E1C1_9RHOB|nr:L,D-transpeptidase family protein [Thioclava sp. FTW29]
MQRRTLLSGLGAMALLSACGDSSKFKNYEGAPVTQIQVFKKDRKMYLFSGDQIVKTYDIALGGQPVGPKQFEGDGKTPEGVYYIDWRNPNSAYHLSLRVSYPNPQQISFAESQGRKPGGDIFIHGQAGANKGRGKDWTAGCIAVNDKQIEEIYSMVLTGTPIFIYP